MEKKQILVVGGAGYIGSHMVKDLLKANHSVIIIDNLSTGHRSLATGGILVEGNFGDTVLLDKIFSEFRIDAVMHFGANALVGESVENPLKYYKNNISRTIRLIDRMIHHRVNIFIFSSTAAVYGEPTEVPIPEGHPCNPTNPYGATKLAVERLLQDCNLAYGLKYVILRYFNAAGADMSGEIGEWHEPETHLIPLVLKVAKGESENIKIFGTDYFTPDKTCIRDYIHVSDLTRAHILALELLLNNGQSAIYNLGNSKGYSVREVLELSRKVTRHPIPAVETGRRAGDPAVLVAKSDKIKKEIGWKPEFEDLEKIIKTAWEWHRSR